MQKMTVLLDRNEKIFHSYAEANQYLIDSITRKANYIRVFHDKLYHEYENNKTEEILKERQDSGTQGLKWLAERLVEDIEELESLQQYKD